MISSSGRKTSISNEIELLITPIEIVQHLNQRATSVLAEATREGRETGYDYAEVVASRALLRSVAIGL